MPWKVVEKDGKFCVHKLDAEGNVGETVPGGCHDTAEKARAQQKALYANEKKELDEKGYVPYGVDTWEELDASREAQDIMMNNWTVMDDFMGLTRNVLERPDVEDKASAIEALTKGLTGRLNKKSVVKEQDPAFLERVVSAVKKAVGLDRETQETVTDNATTGMMLWKEADGTYRWFARYSNNFRDDDDPAEIISADSHRNFVHLVDSKEVDMPELWLWHVPEWRLGKADWVAYDDEGFALAAGYIDKGKEPFADVLSKQSQLAVSHGMPTASIVRDPDDPTIISKHITTEISPLPKWAAANKITGFVILGSDDNKEDDMAIPANKREELVKKWGVSEHLLSALEETNTLDAEKAKADGRESKEKETEETEEQAQQEAQQDSETSQNSDEVTSQAEKTDATNPLNQPPTRQEVADSFAAIVMPFVETLNEVVEQVNAINAEVKELKQTDETKVKNIVASTPAASIAALVAQRMSAVGSPDTSVDGRTPLAKSKPKETKDENDGRIGIPFLDKLMTPAGESEED